MELPFLLSLYELLPADAFPQVAVALMFDPLLWEALHSPLGEKALARLSNHPTAWTPAKIAELAAAEPTGLPADFAAALDLAQALALQQETRPEDNLPNKLLNPTISLYQASTALSILLSQAKLNKPALEKLAAHPKTALATIRAILYQPQQSDLHAEKLNHLLASAPAETRVKMLHHLRASHPTLARQAAPHQLSTKPGEIFNHWVAALTASSTTEALEQLAQVQQQALHLTALAAAQQAQLALENGDLNAARQGWEAALSAAPQNLAYLAGYAFTLAELGDVETAFAHLPADDNSPAALTVRAYLLHFSSPDEARDLAQAAATALRSTHMPAYLFTPLVEVLIAVGETTKAAQIAMLAAQNTPYAAANFARAAILFTKIAEWQSAAEFALWAKHLETSASNLRLFAQIASHCCPDKALETYHHLAETDPRDEDLMAFARLALAQNQPKEAIQAAKRLLVKNPKHAHALTILGQGEMALEDWENAQKHLDLAVTIEPIPEAYLALSEIAKRQNGLTAALEVLEAAIEALPNNSELHLSLGKHLLEANRPAHALPHLEIALADVQVHAQAALLLAEALTNLGRYQEVKSLLEPLSHALERNVTAARLLAKAYLHLGDPAGAQAVLTPHIEKEKATAADLLLYARALIALGKAEAAKHAALRGLAKLGNISPDNSLLYVSLQSVLATALLEQNKTEQALKVYRDAYKHVPAEETNLKMEIVRGLARAAISAHDAASATAALEEILPFAPHDAELHALAAQAYADANKPKEALAAAYNSCRLSDFDPLHARLYAKLAIAQNKSEEAAEVLQQAIARHPQKYELRLILTEALLAAEKPEDAKAALLTLLDPEAFPSAEVCAAAGERLMELDAWPEAINCLRRAVQMHSAPPLTWHANLVKALQATGDNESAVEEAQAALQRADKADEAAIPLFLDLAKSLIALERNHEADEALRAALQTHPHNPSLHQEAVSLWREMGCLHCILENAERYLASHPQDCVMLAHAAAAARDLLMPERARSLLAHLPRLNHKPSECAEGYLLKAELALEAGEEVAAAATLQSIIGLTAESNPRVAALQARLAIRTGDNSRAAALFSQGLQWAKRLKPVPQNAASFGALAEAALELGNWENAQSLTQQAVQACPNSPYWQIRRARYLVIAAEAQTRGEAVELKRHMPGERALGSEAISQWETALHNAAQALGASDAATTHPQLRRWKLRGNAIFHAEPSDELLHSPQGEDVAAWWSARRRSKDASASNPTLPPLGHYLIAFEIALFLEKRGMAAAALRAAENAVRLKPKFAEGHALAARLAFTSQDYQRALKAIRAALALYEDEPRWHALAGKIAIALGDFSLAAQHFDHAVNLEANHLPHRLALANAYAALNQHEKSLMVLRQAEQDFPTSAEVQFALAQTLLHLGNLEEAAYHAEQATREQKPSLDALLLRAQIAQNLGDYQAAAQSAERAQALYGLAPDVALTLAQSYAGLGDYEHALEVTEKAIAKLGDEGAPALEILRAQILSRVSDTNVVEVWQRLSQRYPQKPQVWLGLAEALAEQNRSKEAEEAARRSLSLVEDLSPAEQARLYLLLGRLTAQAGQLDQAVHHLSHAINAAPDNPEAWLLLGRIQADRGLYKDALEAYEQAQRLAPDDPLPYYYAALVAKEIRDFEMAERLLREAARLDPNNLAIQKQLAAVMVINLVH